MDVGNKLNYAKAHVNSISRHDDEDGAVRKAMLTDLRQHIEIEIVEIDNRANARAVKMLQAASAATPADGE